MTLIVDGLLTPIEVVVSTAASVMFLCVPVLFVTGVLVGLKKRK